MCGAYNLIRYRELYFELTPWNEHEILKPFRRYYSEQPRIGNLNPRTGAIMLTRAETEADTYTVALYLSNTLRAKLTSLQSIASWKPQVAVEEILNSIHRKPHPLIRAGLIKKIKRGVESAVSKLETITINNHRSKIPHWVIKTHISKALSSHTLSLVEWTAGGSRYDIYLPVENTRVEVKYVWGYSINYRNYSQENGDIYVIIGKNVSPEKLEQISQRTGASYILYRVDYDEFFTYCPGGGW